MSSVTPQRSSATSASEAGVAEDRFFAALSAGDARQLEELLADDFLIVDVMSAAVSDRASFIAAIRDRLVRFEPVRLVERATRTYGDTAIIVGRTEMAGAFGETRFAVASRYTHVLVRDHDGRWRLATAQGTSIADA